MLVVGIDAHKKSHTAVAVDQVGVKEAEATVPATDAGHLQPLGRARQRFGQAPDRWAVEDCRHLTGRLERALLGAGDAVVRVPPRLMAGARRSVRTPGKSDPIDALAVAGAAVSEQDLPVARLDEPTRELKLLVERRDQLVAGRTREVNRIRWHLHAIDPAQDPAKSAFDTAAARTRLRARLDGRAGIDVELAMMVLEHIDRLCQLIAELTTRIEGLTVDQAPAELVALPGCGPLTATKILAETAGAKQVPIQGLLRNERRCRTDPGPVRQHRRAGQNQPRREPATERRPTPDRHAPSPTRRPRQGLRPPTRRRRLLHRGLPGPETPPRTRRLQHLTRHEQSAATCLPQAA